ncbi:MAG: tRNA (adenosine(37)-N6)-dimethylallyltransferase MiaA [Acidimicrobiales bacterium]
MSVVALLGVTASGKSEAAFGLARRRGDIEIVSVDSMCVYRGMDIGTSKPSLAQQAEVPHHLLDLVDPGDEFTVRQFQHAGHRSLEEIAARGHHALLVGGTGLYLRALVDDLRFPGRYPAIREALETELGEGRAEVTELHARLAVLDPVAAARMEPSNQRRVVRALEVTLGSGRPFSTFGPGLEAYPLSPVTMVGLTAPTEKVDRRIAERFGRWMEEGLLDEVRALAARPGGISPTARQALGYRELLAHVEEGAPLDACVEEAVRRTRSFARRQASWFRRDPRINWTDAGVGPADLLERTLAAHASRS